MMSMRPVVGITAYVEQARWGVWDEPAAVLPLPVRRAGRDGRGTAVVLPPGPSTDADEVLDRLDAVVFAGGADLDPALYGDGRAPADRRAARRPGCRRAAAAAGRAGP